MVVRRSREDFVSSPISEVALPLWLFIELILQLHSGHWKLCLYLCNETIVQRKVPRQLLVLGERARNQNQENVSPEGDILDIRIALNISPKEEGEGKLLEHYHDPMMNVLLV